MPAALFLLPLSRLIIEQRLQQAEFKLLCPTPSGMQALFFPGDWPGDALPMVEPWHKLLTQTECLEIEHTFIAVEKATWRAVVLQLDHLYLICQEGVMDNDKRWKGCLISVLGFLLVGAVKAGPSENNLIIGASQEPSGIQNPWSLGTTKIAQEIEGFTTAKLIYKNNKGELLPDIAERVPTLVNGDYKIYKTPQGKVLRNSVTYRIRKDAKWSDGTSITSQDFEFWLRVAKDIKVPIPSREPWASARIRVESPKVFTIIYSPPYLFAEHISPGLAPAHLMEGNYLEFLKKTQRLSTKSDAGEITVNWNRFIERFTSKGNVQAATVASGPFLPTVWISGNYLKLKRNPYYWRIPEGGLDKYVQEIQYRFFTSTNTLRLNIMANQLDAVSSVGLTFDAALSLLDKLSNKSEVIFTSNGSFENIVIAQRGERAKSLSLDDKRVRKALLYGINRDELTKALFDNHQHPIDTWVNPETGVYKKDTKAYPYDPNQARALLAEVGWRPGPDGILTKNGVKMSLKFSTTAGNSTRERIQQFLKDQWRKIGVDVKIENYPSSVLFSEAFARHSDEGTFDLMLFAETSDPTTEDGSFWAGGNIATRDNGYTGTNYGKFSQEEYDSLWSRAKTEFNPIQRARIFDRMQAIFSEEVPALLIHSRVSSYVRPRDLVNFNYTSHSYLFSWNAYKVGWASRGAIADKD